MTTPDNVLTLPDRSLSVSVARKGLHLTRILVAEIGTTEGKTHDILPGPEHFVGKRNFEHCIVGRTCNRLPAKSFELPSGEIITPQAFPPANPAASLHGGPDGWDQRVWDLLDLQDATLFSPSERTTISSKLPAPQSQLFTLTSPDGDGGYPGEVKAEVLIAVVPSGSKEGGSVVIVYRAALVGDKAKETPINLTQHWGFNLDASLDGPSPTAECANTREHELMIASHHTLSLDSKTALMTGTLSPSDDKSPHNHRAGKAIGENYPSSSPSGGYDDFYLFSDRKDLDTAANPTTFPESKLTSDPQQDFIAPLLEAKPPLKTVASLSSKRSGLALSFTTNQPGVQFYSAPGGGSDKRKKIHGGDEDGSSGYGKEYAAFLEFHAPYAAYQFPELDKEIGTFNTLLKKGSVYSNFARMDVKVGAPSAA